MLAPRTIEWLSIAAVVSLGLLVAPHATYSEDATSGEREELKEPVYRVTNASGNEVVRPTRPQIDPTLSQRQTPVAAPSQPVAVVADPPEKDPQLLLALADAEKCLDYIRTSVQDYTCLFIKREMVNGRIIGPQYAHAKIRHRVVEGGKTVVPFSVYLKYLKPDDIKGREVMYVEGRNDDKILIKEGGLRGRFLPAVWLSKNSPLIMKENRHQIGDVGLERLTQQLMERGRAKDGNLPGIDYTARYGQGAKMNKRSCRYLAVEFKTRKPINDASKLQVLIDQELNLPVRYVAYDWPAAPGLRPQVLEEYTYTNLELNVGLKDIDFDRNNPSYGFR